MTVATLAEEKAPAHVQVRGLFIDQLGDAAGEAAVDQGGGPGKWYVLERGDWGAGRIDCQERSVQAGLKRGGRVDEIFVADEYIIERYPIDIWRTGFQFKIVSIYLCATVQSDGFERVRQVQYTGRNTRK